jgi:prolyl-tRNA editing enzyme YbaK/EbsC (Cys-tRNA(Pro) deacylase)
VRTSVDVHNYLIERDVPHEMFSARGRLRSPERLAAVLGLPPEEVGKVIVFEGPQGALAAVVPAGTVPDARRLGRAAKKTDLNQASDDRASELSEYLPESIPPAGLPSNLGVVIDRSLDRDAVLYFPGGEARSVLKIRGKDLVKATRAKVASILAPPRSATRA